MPMSEERAAGLGREPVLDMDRATVPHRSAAERLELLQTDVRRDVRCPGSPLGTEVRVLAGMTLALRMRGEARTAIVYGGDGATSTGAWHGGFNFADARRCPILIVVEANKWTFSTPTSKRTRFLGFTDEAAGSGVGAEAVDGTEVLEACRAAGRARVSDGSQPLPRGEEGRDDVHTHGLVPARWTRLAQPDPRAA